MVNPLNYSMFNFIAITIATPLIGNALSAEESLDQPPVCGGKLGASIYITYSIDPPTPLGIDIVFIQHSRRAGTRWRNVAMGCVCMATGQNRMNKSHVALRAPSQ